MDFRLTNTVFEADGIFGILADMTGKVVAVTLQHAYDAEVGNGTYAAKISPGTYKCVKGTHRLEGMFGNFVTFEITGVAGHTNLLFHWGNYNKDSEGCVLLGESIEEAGSERMITHSRDTFAKFMGLLTDINTFTLTVENT